MIPKIFVGSSSKGMNIARKIEEIFHDNDDFKAHIKIWKSNDIFCPGNTILSSILKQLDLCDFAIMILTPDDEIVINEEKKYAPRDNVILETGLFAGRIGIERTIIVCKKGENIKIPSDLDGIIRIEYESAENISPVCTKINQHIERLGRRISRLVQSYPNGKMAYKHIKECTANAKKINLIGVCLGSLFEDYYTLLNERANSGAEIILSVADPTKKIIDDFKTYIYGNLHLGDCPSTSTVYNLLQKIKDGKEEKNKNIKLKLFDKPVTFSIMIFDEKDFFVYPYGYKRRGDQSPVFHFVNQETEISRFFMDVATDVILDSKEDYDKINSWKPEEKSE